MTHGRLAALLLMAFPAFAQHPSDAAAPAQWWDHSVWDNPDRAYQWYPPDRPAPPPESPTTPPAPEAERPIRELTSTRAIREALDRLRDAAVVNPTVANVKAYLEAQQYVMEKGSVFADVARRVVWETAELDYSLRRPTNALAGQRFQAERRQQRDETIARLARENGLFFFFRGDCPYCHQLAPILRFLQDRYGLEVFPISLDGSALAEFPGARPDNGIARLLEVAQVPALFLSSKTERKVQPIGYGVLAADEILERMYVLTGLRPGEDF